MSWIVPDWKDVLTKAYSVWFAFAALVLLHASDVIYKLFEIDTNPAAWTWILTWFLIAVIVSRFIPQPESHKWKRRGAVLLFILALSTCHAPAMAQTNNAPSFEDAAFELIARWEGKRNHAYQDIVGVWTVCYGHTKTAHRGQYKTDRECRSMLVEEIFEYREGYHVALSASTKRYRLTPLRDAAYTSLCYNVGVRGCSRSTAVRRLNRGDVAGGCKALTWWNKAGGRVVRGLVNRRAAEERYCLAGVA